MPAGPKDKSVARSEPRGAVSSDSVSLVVAVTLVGLGAGGILAVFSGPLFALLTH